MRSPNPSKASPAEGDSRVCLEVTRVDCVYELLSKFDNFLLARCGQNRLAMKMESKAMQEEPQNSSKDSQRASLKISLIREALARVRTKR